MSELSLGVVGQGGAELVKTIKIYGGNQNILKINYSIFLNEVYVYIVYLIGGDCYCYQLPFKLRPYLHLVLTTPTSASSFFVGYSHR